MEKKIYMPSMDDLYKMQDLNANIYKYILTKAIESIIMEGVNLPNKGMLKGAYKYLSENPDIAYAICAMYPEEIKYSEIAREDPSLCLTLMQMDMKEKKSSLDYISYFDPSVIKNSLVFEEGIIGLERELSTNPYYRFNYRSNFLFDRIFNGEIQNKDFDGGLIKTRQKIIDSLVKIEPSYAVSLSSEYFNDKRESLWNGINNYANRYKIRMDAGEEYYRHDILTNPDTNVKRLLKCIDERKR